MLFILIRFTFAIAQSIYIISIYPLEPSLTQHIKRCWFTLMLHIIIFHEVIQYIPKVFCFLQKSDIIGYINTTLVSNFNFFVDNWSIWCEKHLYQVSSHIIGYSSQYFYQHKQAQKYMVVSTYPPLWFIYVSFRLCY